VLCHENNLLEVILHEPRRLKPTLSITNGAAANGGGCHYELEGQRCGRLVRNILDKKRSLELTIDA
jgi:hypothetical protein